MDFLLSLKNVIENIEKLIIINVFESENLTSRKTQDNN